jgi:hypothetical protein
VYIDLSRQNINIDWSVDRVHEWLNFGKRIDLLPQVSALPINFFCALCEFGRYCWMPKTNRETVTMHDDLHWLPPPLP